MGDRRRARIVHADHREHVARNAIGLNADGAGWNSARAQDRTDFVERRRGSVAVSRANGLLDDKTSGAFVTPSMGKSEDFGALVRCEAAVADENLQRAILLYDRNRMA